MGTDTPSVTNIGLVGGGDLCAEILKKTTSVYEREQIYAPIIAVADADPESPGMKLAEELGLLTLTDYHELYDKRYDHVRPYFENLFHQTEILPEFQPDRVMVAPDAARALVATDANLHVGDEVLCLRKHRHRLGEEFLDRGQVPLGTPHRRVVNVGVGREHVVEQIPVLAVDGMRVVDEQILDLQAIGNFLWR